MLADHAYTYWECLILVGFLAAIWAAGKIMKVVRMPPVLGEMLVGIGLGPFAANVFGSSERNHFVMMVGEIGFLMMIIEAGIEIDVAMLLQVGTRALGVALLGLAVPVSIGMVVATIFGYDAKAAFAAAMVIGPTSLGIALSILRPAGILNTPTGQLIVSAAVFDDIVALVLLAQIEAIADPTLYNILMPILSSLALIGGVGYLALVHIPGWLSRFVLPKVPDKYKERFLLFLVLALAAGLSCVAFVLRSSRYLGVFLAGLTFCTMHSVEYIWVKQVKRLQTWLVRIFFAATVGFEIPINDLWNARTWSMAGAFLLAWLGKLVTGVFARPLYPEWLKVGTAMLPHGEFSFVIAATASYVGVLPKELKNAVLLTVVISMFASPIIMSTTLAYLERKLSREIDLVADGDVNAELLGYEAVYYRLNVRCLSKFGLLDKVMGALRNQDITVLDFRLEYEGKLTACEAYLKDDKLRLTGDVRSKGGLVATKDLAERVVEIREGLIPAVSHDEEAVAGSNEVIEALQQYQEEIATMIEHSSMSQGGRRSLPAPGVPLYDDEIDDYVRDFRGLVLVRWTSMNSTLGAGVDEEAVAIAAHDELLKNAENDRKQSKSTVHLPSLGGAGGADRDETDAIMTHDDSSNTRKSGVDDDEPLSPTGITVGVAGTGTGGLGFSAPSSAMFRNTADQQVFTAAMKSMLHREAKDEAANKNFRGAVRNRFERNSLTIVSGVDGGAYGGGGRDAASSHPWWWRSRGPAESPSWAPQSPASAILESPSQSVEEPRFTQYTHGAPPRKSDQSGVRVRLRAGAGARGWWWGRGRWWKGCSGRGRI